MHRRHRRPKSEGDPTSSRYIPLQPARRHNDSQSRRGSRSRTPPPCTPRDGPTPRAAIEDVPAPARDDHTVAYYVRADKIRGVPEHVCAPGWPVWTQPYAHDVSGIHDGAYMPWGQVFLGYRCTDPQHCGDGSNWILVDVPCEDGEGHRTMWIAAAYQDREQDVWWEICPPARTSECPWIRQRA